MPSVRVGAMRPISSGCQQASNGQNLNNQARILCGPPHISCRTVHVVGAGTAAKIDTAANGGRVVGSVVLVNAAKWYEAGRSYLPRNSCGPSDAAWFLSIMSNTLVSYAMNSSWDTVPSPSVSILCIISLVCRPRA